MLLTAVGIAALSYVAACFYLWRAQRELIFAPEVVVDRTPAALGIAFVDVRIPVGEGSGMAGWWLPSGVRDARSPVVLYLHGNDGNLARELVRLQALQRQGLAILAIDYRGYGRSSGPSPSETQVYDDAAFAWDYLVRIRGIAPQRIVIYGHSLGAAIAVELAVRRGPACGVVLESPFTSVAEIARLHYPWVPVEWLLHQRFDALAKIERVEVPLILVHGTADREVPAAMSTRLYEAAGAPKRLILVEDAGHEDAVSRGGESLQRAITELVRRCTA